jgi:cobalt-precorrin-7 (C5)-methyltransferase
LIIPDSGEMAGNSITVVAVGPGNPDFLTLRGREALESADIVLGFNTVLNVVRPWLAHAEICPMSYRDQEQVFEYAESQVRQGKKCVVCCWGDLNVSARELLERVRRRAENVKLVPGISSVQVAMARTGISLEDSIFITLHKRADSGSEFEELAHYITEGRRHIIVLPRPYDLMPAGIAKGLLELGVSLDLATRVYQRLSLEDEKCWSGALQECSEISEDFSDLSIMVFLSGEASPQFPLSQGESNVGNSPGA